MAQMSEATQQTKNEAIVSGTVKIPVENECPKCGEHVFGHGVGEDYWQTVKVEGTITAYRTDNGEITYGIGFDCQNCEHEFREPKLTPDEIEIVEDND